MTDSAWTPSSKTCQSATAKARAREIRSFLSAAKVHQCRPKLHETIPAQLWLKGLEPKTLSVQVSVNIQGCQCNKIHRWRTDKVIELDVSQNFTRWIFYSTVVRYFSSTIIKTSNRITGSTLLLMDRLCSIRIAIRFSPNFQRCRLNGLGHLAKQQYPVSPSAGSRTWQAASRGATVQASRKLFLAWTLLDNVHGDRITLSSHQTRPQPAGQGRLVKECLSR